MASGRLLAIREAGFAQARVAAVRQLTPALRVVSLASPFFDALPGAEAVIRFVHGEGDLEERHYSVWTVDRQASTLDLCVVLHGLGPGSRWAAGCAVGDAVELSVGRTLPVSLDPGAAHHLFLGDETSVAAAEALTQGLPADAPSSAVFEVASDDQRWPHAELARPETVRWLPRDGRPGLGLAAWLGALRLPRPDATAVYLTGEAWLCATAHGRLVRDAGVPAHRIRAVPFWKRRPPS